MGQVMSRKSSVEWVKRFWSDRSGNFAVATGAAISVLVLAGGFAINIAQLTLTKSNLQQALDSAVTSTARDLTTHKIDPEDADAMVSAFLQANGIRGFAQADRVTLDRVEVDRSTRMVTAHASVVLNLAFPVFRSSTTRRIAVESAALYSDKRIEVAMMLDVTGSMAGQKIKDLRKAAKGAVSTFLTGQDPDDPRVRVAIVPYADSVNVGALANTVNVETGYTTDEPPAIDSARSASSSFRPDTCATERKGRYQFSDASPWKAMPSRDYRLQFCPGAQLSPLTADRARLDNRIDSFSADGATAGHIGIQWTWYMLSREWKDFLPTGSAPARASDDKTAKFAILMTDGEFNTAFAGVGRWEQPRTQQQTRSRNHAERLCEEMKKDGIEIFTVGFMLKESAARQVMAKCASPDKASTQHFFEATSGAELDAAFQAIAANIERLAIVK